MLRNVMTVVAAATLALPFALGSASAAEEKKPTAQQSKMVSCNKEAGDKKGDERKAFMKECLSAKKAEVMDKRAAQQEKMKACNTQAADKKGDERRKFMSECLKG